MMRGVVCIASADCHMAFEHDSGVRVCSLASKSAAARWCRWLHDVAYEGLAFVLGVRRKRRQRSQSRKARRGAA